jgi:hypothetical protein
MSGCCRTIQTQLTEVEKAQNCIKNCSTPQKKVHAIHRTLNLFRRIFGSYKVDSALTSTFRREVEPSLENVWTPQDLDDYTIRLRSFSEKVEGSLHQWRSKYCKEGVTATT